MLAIVAGLLLTMLLIWWRPAAALLPAAVCGLGEIAAMGTLTPSPVGIGQLLVRLLEWPLPLLSLMISIALLGAFPRRLPAAATPVRLARVTITLATRLLLLALILAVSGDYVVYRAVGLDWLNMNDPGFAVAGLVVTILTPMCVLPPTRGAVHPSSGLAPRQRDADSELI